MLNKENISYQVTMKEGTADIVISFVDTNLNKYGGVYDFACYFLKDGNIIDKKMYQRSKRFQFDLLGSGTYSFTIFVRDKAADIVEPVIRQTEKFEVRQYEMAIIAEHEIIDICSGITGLQLNKYGDLEGSIADDNLFIDIVYLTDVYADWYCEDRLIIDHICNKLEDYLLADNNVILLIKDIQGYHRQTLIDEIISKCKEYKVRLINCHQILQKDRTGKLRYEDYQLFCNALKDQLEVLLRDACSGFSALDYCVDIKVMENKLRIIVSSSAGYDATQCQYYILRDGQVVYKHGIWEPIGEFSFDLMGNGIYVAQVFLKQNSMVKIIKSHSVEYFQDIYREEFEKSCYRSGTKKKKGLDFYKLSEPFVDFVVIQSKTPIDRIELQELEFSYLNTYGDRINYCISGKSPVEKHGKSWVCSGILSSENDLLYGDDMLDAINSLEGSKTTGTYSIAEIDRNRIYISNDYFAFNRIFYYSDCDITVCSNRYHLLLMVLRELRISLKLDENKALMTLSSVRLPYLTQNMCSRMDMDGVRQCPNSYDIVLDKNGLSFNINAYGKVLREDTIIDEGNYRKELERGCKEIINNVNTIIKNGQDKNFVVDLSGGMDSRIVYAAALQSEYNRGQIFIHSHDVRGSKDLDIAVMINGLYNLSWDTLQEERRKFENQYNDMMQRSFYMGTYYSHNLIGASTTNDATVRLVGACGEILLRPYTVRKFLGTEVS